MRPTRTNRVAPLAATIAAALIVTACAPADDDDGVADEPTESETAVSPSIDDLRVPVTARYGVLDLTVAAVEIADSPPPELASQSATWVAVDLEIANQIDGSTFTLPPGMFTLISDDIDYAGQSADGNDLEVRKKGQATTETTLWFELPEGDPLTGTWLQVDETGFEPLAISLTGAEMPSQTAEVTMKGEFRTECKAVVPDGTGAASYNLGVTEDGEPHPMPGEFSTLGRAPEDQVYVSFPIIATESCVGAATWFQINSPVFSVFGGGWVGDFKAPSQDNAGQIHDSVRAQLVFLVPEESTESLVVRWHGLPGDEGEATTTASLAPLADLVTDGRV